MYRFLFSGWDRCYNVRQLRGRGAFSSLFVIELEKDRDFVRNYDDVYSRRQHIISLLVGFQQTGTVEDADGVKGLLRGYADRPLYATLALGLEHANSQVPVSERFESNDSVHALR